MGKNVKNKENEKTWGKLGKMVKNGEKLWKNEEK